jgi:hypothetical protein
MDVNEIDEISEAFLEAWIDFFGAPMYLVPFDRESSDMDEDEYTAIYREPKQFVYNFAEKVLFHGALKDHESLDKDSVMGLSVETDLSVVCITKELADKGITKIPLSSIIEFMDNTGEVRLYKIVDVIYRVQLSSHRIFTKMKIVELTDAERGVV